MFVVIALSMHGGCCMKYEANDGATAGEERYVSDQGASVSCACANGNICMW